MTERMKLLNKVHKGIECCKEYYCGECPYEIYDDKGGTYILRCINKLMNDLASTMEPVKYKKENGRNICPVCKKDATHMFMGLFSEHCPHCGTPIDWH